ncbi:MAG: hypothetical protein GX545_06120 [Fibrobacter sp.]|jgi:anti-anti-sigma regulatory factor|nr:hypothetical protein [Fibrobacter sp.]
MVQLKNYREVGIFDLLSAPLNPIGAFDAERFKVDVRALINKKSNFIAVDLTGIDFLYSDAYNALMLFQKELATTGGVIGILTNNKIIIDGLHRAGLDKKVKLFSTEAALMDFSTHSTAIKDDVEIPLEENIRSAVSMNQVTNSSDEKKQPHKRTTGRFTKSFNAITKEDSSKVTSGMQTPFLDDTSSSHLLLWIMIILFMTGAIVAYFVLK